MFESEKSARINFSQKVRANEDTKTNFFEK